MTKTKPKTKQPKDRVFELSLFSASIFILLLSVVALIGASVLAYERTHIPYEGIAIGKTISVGSSKLTVQKVAYKPGAVPFVAPKGYEYMIVTLQVQNTSEKPFSVIPTTDTYVKTDAGKVSYLTPYALENPFHSGVILPGDATAGELSYLVPIHGHYRFYVESSWTSTAIPFMVKSTDSK